MKTPSGKIGIPTIAIAVFVGVMMLLSFYFFYTISENRQSVEEQGFRELNQLGVALRNQDDMIRNMVGNYSEKIVDTVKKIALDSLKKAGKKKNPASGRFRNDSGISLEIYEKSPVTRNIFIDPWTRKNLTDSIVFKVKGSNIITCRISYRDFLAPFLKKDFFTDFILIRNDTLSFSSTAAELYIARQGETKTKVKKNQSLFSFLQSNDMADTSYNQFIQSGSIHKVKIEGVKYELFLAPVKFSAGDHGTIFVGGLIPEDKISAWEKDLPANWVMIILIVLLFIIFSFPILKIFIAGGNEKITRLLVTMVGISVVAGLFLLTIFASDMLIEYRTKSETDQNLENLSDSIQNAFRQERLSILQQLHKYDSVGKEMAGKKEYISSLLASDSGAYNPDYRYFKTMFWADRYGRQNFFITPYANSSSTYIGYRNYFKKPEVYEDSLGGRQMWYNMEPIYSNTSGEWILAFSTPAKDQKKDRIVAITSWMYSIKSTILPEDYEYCLVEKTGRIWYHSNELFNLTDNFLEECDNPNINAAFSSNATNTMNITLRNHRYRAHIEPVSNTNLFIVTMFNPSGVKSIEAITAGTAILYFGLIAMIIMVLYLLMQLGGLKNKLLRSKDFFFEWLIPVERKKEVYALLLLINIISSALFLFAGLSGLIRELSLSLIMWGFIIIITTNFLFSIFLLTLQPTSDYPDRENFFTRRKKWLRKKLRPFKNEIRRWIKHFTVYDKNVRNLYTSFMISWLLVNTVLPAIFFMVRFHNEETKHYIVNQFLGIAERLNQRTDSLARFYSANIPLGKGDSLFYNRDRQGLYFTTIWKTNIRDLIDSTSGNRWDKGFAVIYGVHYYFNKVMRDVENHVDPLLDSRINVTDTSYGIAFKRNVVRYPADSLKTGREIKWQCINTTSKGGSGIFKLLDAGWASVIFFLLIGIVLTLMHLLIRKIVHKLFDYDGLSATMPTLKEQLASVAEKGKNSIIVSLNELMVSKDELKDWTVTDMNDPDFSTKPAKEKTILVNLEVNLLMPGEIMKRLRQLEKFLHESQVVLLLNKTPGQLADSLPDAWEIAAAMGKEQNSNLESYPTLLEGVEYFRKIIFSLPVIFVKPEPLKNSNMPLLRNILKWEAMINPEITDHEKKLQPLLEESKAADKIILAIQELSTARYSYIWNNLSGEEHFILYELAKGAMINLNNREPIRILFNKGILRSDEMVEFTSAAFRNFILTSIDTGDIMEIEKQSLRTGNWSKFRLPVLLMAASIVVFLFATQQNVLSNLNAILLSIATLLGVYLKFSGLFVKDSK